MRRTIALLLVGVVSALPVVATDCAPRPAQAATTIDTTDTGLAPNGCWVSLAKRRQGESQTGWELRWIDFNNRSSRVGGSTKWKWYSTPSPHMTKFDHGRPRWMVDARVFPNVGAFGMYNVYDVFKSDPTANGVRATDCYWWSG